MFPDTRISLVIRLAETADVEAWQEFVDLYAPVLLSIARRKGLQPVDAEDLVQEILMAVARAIHRFEPDQRRAKFRSWLGAIARNLIADMLSGNARRPIVRAITDSWLRELESQNVETVGHVPPSEYDWITQEYRRSVFRVAAGRVQKRVNENTWQAFYLTKISSASMKTPGKLSI